MDGTAKRPAAFTAGIPAGLLTELLRFATAAEVDSAAEWARFVAPGNEGRTAGRLLVDSGPWITRGPWNPSLTFIGVGCIVTGELI